MALTPEEKKAKYRARKREENRRYYYAHQQKRIEKAREERRREKKAKEDAAEERRIAEFAARMVEKAKDTASTMELLDTWMDDWEDVRVQLERKHQEQSHRILAARARRQEQINRILGGPK